MRPHDSVDQPAKPPTVQSPQPGRILRFSTALLKIVELCFFLATLFIFERDSGLTRSLSRPILWMALFILPGATMHVAATMRQDRSLKLISVPLYRAGSVALALIWPLVISVFLFGDLLGTRQRVWVGISSIILLVAGIVLIQVARYDKHAFSIQGPKWPAIMLAILIGIVGIMTVVSLLR